MHGLYFQVVLDNKAKTGLKDYSKGRGSVRYIDTPEGARLRVDSYLIPLAEIYKEVGESIRLCYFARSPEPEYIVNTAGTAADEGKSFYSNRLPYESLGILSDSSSQNRCFISSLLTMRGGHAGMVSERLGRGENSHQGDVGDHLDDE